MVKMIRYVQILSWFLVLAACSERGQKKTGLITKFPGSPPDTFRVECSDVNNLPTSFKNGYVLIYQREEPGIIYLVDTGGNIRWYKQFNGTGCKVVRFTDSNTFLCLLGTKDFQTGYGNAIMEISLAGDTLFHLQKGDKDFQQTIHHEIFFNRDQQIVTICQDKKIFDLRSKGGLEKDTVAGDGILVIDKQGKKIWSWSVFDVIDPHQDDSILTNKKDWMHANSLAFDRDGNYLMSFYNNGQIWKINSITGDLIWKLGRGGDFEMPANASFDEAHAVHINDRGWLMFFDNGAKNHVSRSMAFSVDESNRKIRLELSAWLPPQLYSDRMGSTYMVGDTCLLECSSKSKTLLLSNLNSRILWQLKSNHFISYRAEFIEGNRIPSLSLLDQ